MPFSRTVFVIQKEREKTVLFSPSSFDTQLMKQINNLDFAPTNY